MALAYAGEISSEKGISLAIITALASAASFCMRYLHHPTQKKKSCVRQRAYTTAKDARKHAKTHIAWRAAWWLMHWRAWRGRHYLRDLR